MDERIREQGEIVAREVGYLLDRIRDRNRMRDLNSDHCGRCGRDLVESINVQLNAETRTSAADDGVDGERLESVTADSSAAILSADQNFCGESSRGLRNEAETTSRTDGNCPGQAQREQLTMPVLTLGSNRHAQIRYRVPRRGAVEYEVEAEYPVDSFIVDEDGAEEIRRGTLDKDLRMYGVMGRQKTYHSETVKLNFTGSWYLIIRNTSSRNIAVSYEVWM